MEYLEGWEARPAAEPAVTADERRIKRMMSNRESARRSRLRKQRHIDELRQQLNHHKALKLVLLSRLSAAAQGSFFLRCDNDRLLSESALLLRRLSEVQRFVLCRQFQRLNMPPAAAACGGFASGGEPNLSSLIINN